MEQNFKLSECKKEKDTLILGFEMHKEAKKERQQRDDRDVHE